MPPQRILIAAVSDNNVIGYQNRLPWERIPGDMKHFKETTMGHPVIMGRRTLESIKRPLEGRENIVLTRNGEFINPGIITCHSLEEAFDLTSDYEKVFIIGGARVYKEALEKDLVDQMELTWVHRVVPGDSYFPEINWDGWLGFKYKGLKDLSFITYKKR